MKSVLLFDHRGNPIQSGRVDLSGRGGRRFRRRSATTSANPQRVPVHPEGPSRRGQRQARQNWEKVKDARDIFAKTFAEWKRAGTDEHPEQFNKEWASMSTTNYGENCAEYFEKLLSELADRSWKP